MCRCLAHLEGIRRTDPGRDHRGQADAGSEIHHGVNPKAEGRHTTHYTVVDKAGNAVSVTTTINSPFGSKCVVEGAGFLLNNEMDDFSAKPGAPNQYGLIGGQANAIARPSGCSAP